MAFFKSAFTVSFFISLSRILGFIRDILIAKFLGVGILSDVFFAAFRLPNFFRRIFAEGAFNSAFIPIFVEQLQLEDNRQKSLLFVRNIFSFLLYILLLLVIILQIFMPFFMTIFFPGFTDDAQKFSLLVTLSRITIFYLLFISLVSLFSAVLNSIGKFAAPSSTPIILNITLIFSLFILADLTPNFAYALSWGVFVAGILQFFYLLFFLLKERIFLYPILPKITDQTKNFFCKLLPGIIGANVMQINLLINTMIASLIPGAVSYLYYADRISQLPLAMIGIAIGIALLPTLSKKIKAGKKHQAIALQNTALEISLVLTIPATFALACLSHFIITVLFERGEFDSQASILVARALKFYAFGLPAYVMVKVLEPSFFARGNTKTPMKIAIVCLISNIILNIIFFKPFGYIGIVLASVLSSYLNITLLFFNLSKNKQFTLEKDFGKKFLKILAAAILMLWVIFALREYFSGLEIFHPILELIIIIAAGLVSFLSLAYIFGSLKVIAHNFKPSRRSTKYNRIGI